MNRWFSHIDKLYEVTCPACGQTMKPNRRYLRKVPWYRVALPDSFCSNCHRRLMLRMPKGSNIRYALGCAIFSSGAILSLALEVMNRIGGTEDIRRVSLALTVVGGIAMASVVFDRRIALVSVDSQDKSQE